MSSSKNRAKKETLASRFALYEAAVQNTTESIQCMRRIFKKHRGRHPRLIREDFCGTAAIATAWAARHRNHRAWAVDLDPEALAWGKKHNVNLLGKASSRVELVCADVLEARKPRVEVINAFNFSYFVFHERDVLRQYFKAAKDSLVDDGIFICDIFGGTEAMTTNIEKRTVPASVRPDGTRVPSFKYVWEHEHFDVISNGILCHIHFKLRGKKIRTAFTYDWRLWTIPEVREIMMEAGFASAEVYIHGWTENGECDNRFKIRRKFENSEGWLAYIVGLR